MKKVNDLISQLSKAKKVSRDHQEKQSNLIDKIHESILQEIVSEGMLTSLQWYVPQYNYRYINQIDAFKDESWNKIVKVLERSEKIHYDTRNVSLTDDIVLCIEGHIVSLLPMKRQTDADRQPDQPAASGREYITYMASTLMEFVKSQKLKVDFSKIEEAKVGVLKDLELIDSILLLGKGL